MSAGWDIRPDYRDIDESFDPRDLDDRFDPALESPTPGRIPNTDPWALPVINLFPQVACVDCLHDVEDHSYGACFPVGGLKCTCAREVFE